MDVWRSLPARLGNQSEQAVWLTPGAERTISRNIFGRIWWWLPPVIWPAEEKAWSECLDNMTRLGAALDCQKGRYRQGIKALEELLQRNRIPYPPAD